ncbi:unannotated protein [freshwater metagenome]|uniref:Unannotated protein n=1 Tax=freshwater metagenome TaxID=449393 RepID=A0A6J7DFZ3_9ZZZZ
MTIAHVSLLDERTIITIEGTDAGAWVLPCGMTSLYRRHLTADPPLPEDLTNAIGEMTDHLDDARRELPLLGDATSVVVSGPAARAMAAVEHGGRVNSLTFVLSRDAAEDVFRTLATEATADRRQNPGLPNDLVDAIVGGCCAMVALIRGLGLDSVTVSMVDQP